MRLSRGSAVLASALAVTLAPLAVPASANHLVNVTVTQVETTTAAGVTLQFDVEFTKDNSAGQFRFTTGDGREAILADGVVGGVYAGDASGAAAFGGAQVVGARSYSWRRTSPAPGISRTRVEYNYVSRGSYPVTWEAAGPTKSGALTANATGTSVADCVMGGGAQDSITYTPAITSLLVPQRVDFEMDAVLVCTGSAPASGTYNLHIAGTTSETCGFGQSDDALVTGTKSSSRQTLDPDGDGTQVSRWNHHREGIHLFGYPDPQRPQQSGEFFLTDSATRYELNLWLDLPATAAVCPDTGGAFSWGHATIRT